MVNDDASYHIQKVKSRIPDRGEPGPLRRRRVQGCFLLFLSPEALQLGRAPRKKVKNEKKEGFFCDDSAVDGVGENVRLNSIR